MSCFQFFLDHFKEIFTHLFVSLLFSSSCQPKRTKNQYSQDYNSRNLIAVLTKVHFTSQEIILNFWRAQELFHCISPNLNWICNSINLPIDSTGTNEVAFMYASDYELTELMQRNRLRKFFYRILIQVLVSWFNSAEAVPSSQYLMFYLTEVAFVLVLAVVTVILLRITLDESSKVK